MSRYLNCDNRLIDREIKQISLDYTTSAQHDCPAKRAAKVLRLVVRR
ncbi:MAG: hypothetical protein OFPII_03380 [Osedax symbiont Rs1]|nr:MAG: hypothetical protein OFPII_03380 [Osedax symbiont Rs1]